MVALSYRFDVIPSSNARCHLILKSWCRHRKITNSASAFFLSLFSRSRSKLSQLVNSPPEVVSIKT